MKKISLLIIYIYFDKSLYRFNEKNDFHIQTVKKKLGKAVINFSHDQRNRTASKRLLAYIPTDGKFN